MTLVWYSPSIGYNFKCDVQQLSHSYGDLKCFKHYEMLLDIQNVFKEHQGGLSGLAVVIHMPSSRNACFFSLLFFFFFSFPSTS